MKYVAMVIVLVVGVQAQVDTTNQMVFNDSLIISSSISLPEYGELYCSDGSDSLYWEYNGTDCRTVKFESRPFCAIVREWARGRLK